MLTLTIFGLLFFYMTECLLRILVAERLKVCVRGVNYVYGSVQFREPGDRTASQWY